MCGRGRIEEAAWARERKREREREPGVRNGNGLSNAVQPKQTGASITLRSIKSSLARRAIQRTGTRARAAAWRVHHPPTPGAGGSAGRAAAARGAGCLQRARRPGPSRRGRSLSLSHRRSHPPSIVRSFSTHGQLSAAQGSLTTLSRSVVRLIQHLDSSALGLVWRWPLLFPHPRLPTFHHNEFDATRDDIENGSWTFDGTRPHFVVSSAEGAASGEQ
jgi:hypothetical protein